MGTQRVDTDGECEVGGSLFGVVRRSNGRVELPDLRDEDLAPRPVRKASWKWRARNWLRMLFHGEHFVPWIARIPAAARWCRWVPVAGPIIAGSVGAVAIGWGELRGVYRTPDGDLVDYGVIGNHMVVTAGKNYLASGMDGTNSVSAFKYHGFGLGTTAAAVGDTALQTELTTQYATDNTRPTGSQAHSSNTYTTVATLTPDSAIACTEWGLFMQAATDGGTLLDHQVFSAINLNGTGDSLQTTYTLTFS